VFNGTGYFTVTLDPGYWSKATIHRNSVITDGLERRDSSLLNNDP